MVPAQRLPMLTGPLLLMGAVPALVLVPAQVSRGRLRDALEGLRALFRRDTLSSQTEK